MSFILGTRIAYVPQVITEWRDKHPGQEIPDQQVFTQPWPATASEKARGIPDRVIYYQYRHDRARRTLRGIDEQVTKTRRSKHLRWTILEALRTNIFPKLARPRIQPASGAKAVLLEISTHPSGSEYRQAFRAGALGTDKLG